MNFLKSSTLFFPKVSTLLAVTWLPLLALGGLCVLSSSAEGNTGTFIDRQQEDDIRVVSYNVLFETIFPEENASQAAKFERVVLALDPDVLNMQEIWSHSASDVVQLLNSIAPLGGGASWFAHQGGDNIIASKYPLSLQATNTNPPKDGTALALVDLPDAIYGADLYVMNNHFSCCNESNPPEPDDAREDLRQQQADALVGWMDDARNPGGFITLAQDTPMLVVGDLNIINEPDLLDPLGTLITGDIFHEATFGSDSPPDWDGTSLADAHPLHNGTGPADYTWRNDGSPFDPGRLDYILYTDSVLQMANNFILNTVAMTPAERAATGLSLFDITVDLAGSAYDHLPLITDFRLTASIPFPGDYNEDGFVNAADYTVWRDNVGAAAGTLPNDTGGGIIGPAQYATWQANFGNSFPLSSETIPEPTAVLLLTLTTVGALIRQREKGTTEDTDIHG